VGASKARRCRSILVILVFFAALGVLREWDSTLDRLIPAGGWKLPALIVIVSGLVLLYRYWDSVRNDLASFLHTPAFAIL
jgi:hypothetical protein